MGYTCIIVDDNAVARVTLRQLIKQDSDLELLGEYADPIDALQFLQKNNVDILFLDIEMPQMSGLELSTLLLGKNSQVVFISRKEEYAIDAFNLQVADYILKPVTPLRFFKALERVKLLLGKQTPAPAAEKEEQRDWLFFRDGSVVKKVAFEEILFVEAQGDYVKITTTKQYYLVHSTLRAIDAKLPAKFFVKVHRSYIINIAKIDSIQTGFAQMGAHAIPLSNAYRNDLNNALNLL